MPDGGVEFSDSGKMFSKLCLQILETDVERKKQIEAKITKLIYATVAVLAVGAVTASGAVNDLFVTICA